MAACTEAVAALAPNAAPAKLAHAVLNTADIETLSRWWCEVLGFRVSDWSERQMAFLRCNPDHHSIAFNEAGPPDYEFTRLLLGGRGTGKTALLAVMRERAAERGMVALEAEAGRRNLEHRVQTLIAQARARQQAVWEPAGPQRRRHVSGVASTCNEWMPRAKARCVLAAGHRGYHRSRRP